MPATPAIIYTRIPSYIDSIRCRMKNHAPIVITFVSNLLLSSLDFAAKISSIISSYFNLFTVNRKSIHCALCSICENRPCCKFSPVHRHRLHLVALAFSFRFPQGAYRSHYDLHRFCNDVKLDIECLSLVLCNKLLLD